MFEGQLGKPAFCQVNELSRTDLRQPRVVSAIAIGQEHCKPTVFLDGRIQLCAFEIRDAAGRFIGRPDLYYEDQKLGIEYDGAGHRNALVADNHRQNNLLGVGVRLLRFTYTDVMEDSDSVVLHVKQQLG